MTRPDSASLWKLHAQLLGAVALALALACAAYVAAGAGGAPMGVVASVAAIGYAIYAVLASVFVAALGPTATAKKVAMASAMALVLAPIATASLLTMRVEKPKAPASAPPGAARAPAPAAPGRP
jgi:hypothetical protein